MCEESTLPVLCISFVGFSSASLEIWNASRVYIHSVGGAGVGVERVSKYGCEFDGRGVFPGDSSACGIVEQK